MKEFIIFFSLLTFHFLVLTSQSVTQSELGALEPGSSVRHSNVGLILTYTKIMVSNKNNCGWLIMGPHFCTEFFILYGL